MGRNAATGRYAEMIGVVDFVRRNRQVVDWVDVRPQAAIRRGVGQRPPQVQQVHQHRVDGELEAPDFDEPEVIF